MDSIAARYAGALFELALENKAVVVFQKEMKEVQTIIEENDDLINFFAHYNIDVQAKKELLAKVFKDRLSVFTFNFLGLLIDKKRIGDLMRICREFNALANQHQGIQEGVVYSTIRLDASLMTSIKARIEKETNFKIELTNKIDETLIGGFKVIIKDTVYDNSLKNKIDSLKYELLEGKR